MATSVNSTTKLKVAAFKTICENLIPADHPPYNFNCRGGFAQTNGEGEFSLFLFYLVINIFQYYHTPSAAKSTTVAK